MLDWNVPVFELAANRKGSKVTASSPELERHDELACLNRLIRAAKLLHTFDFPVACRNVKQRRVERHGGDIYNFLR